MRAKSCHKSNHDYYFLCFPVKSFRTKHRISIELIRYSVILAYYMTQNIIVILFAQEPFLLRNLLSLFRYDPTAPYLKIVTIDVLGG